MPGDLTAMPLVLMYHSVSRRGADPNLITVSPSRFRRQMDWLKRRGLRGSSMQQLLDAADRGSTAGLIGLTFDDGYADFTTDVAPVLTRFGFTATIYAVAGKLGGSNDWDIGPEKALMTADELREAVRLGAEIGSHGFSHRALSTADPDVLVLEIQESRDILRALLDEPIRGFCYPYGVVSDAAIRAARDAGYDYAVATRGSAKRNRFAMPRTYVGERDGVSRLQAKRLRHWLTRGRP